ncbi:MAG: 50S ribosomal protein L5 [Candidatus Aenigmarchaeota archaeon]|nr:50S ribosomal protein L5 [Candidatus Aenigmarchaeota archaeon]
MSEKMREIRVGKLTLNIGMGSAPEKLDKARIVLERLTGKKIVLTKTKSRTTFGTPKGKPIGAKVTLRGKEATELLKRFLESKENRLLKTNFDSTGNFSFGIEEYIHVPGVKYDPEIGILGMDVSVTLERPGYRVKRRKIASKIGKRHLITKEDAMDFVSRTFGVAIEKKEQ